MIKHGHAEQGPRSLFESVWGGGGGGGGWGGWGDRIVRGLCHAGRLDFNILEIFNIHRKSGLTLFRGPCGSRNQEFKSGFRSKCQIFQ